MVGHWENSLIPWRNAGSARMSMPLKVTSRWFSTWTTAAEKPHCGKTGVPFMNSTTSVAPISCSICLKTGLSLISVSLFRRCLQSQRVQFVAHPPLQRRIDHLVLLNAGFSLEGRRHYIGSVMVAVTPEVVDANCRIGQGLLDHGLDRLRVHRHRRSAFDFIHPLPAIYA